MSQRTSENINMFITIIVKNFYHCISQQIPTLSACVKMNSLCMLRLGGHTHYIGAHLCLLGN